MIMIQTLHQSILHLDGLISCEYLSKYVNIFSLMRQVYDGRTTLEHQEGK